MTNMEYIMQNMTERGLAELIVGNLIYFECDSVIATRAGDAFTAWRDNLCKYPGNVYHTDDATKRPSVYATSLFYYYKAGRQIGTSASMDVEMPRSDVVSFQVWLSKQYNANEWNES